MLLLMGTMSRWRKYKLVRLSFTSGVFQNMAVYSTYMASCIASIAVRNVICRPWPKKHAASCRITTWANVDRFQNWWTRWFVRIFSMYITEIFCPHPQYVAAVHCESQISENYQQLCALHLAISVRKQNEMWHIMLPASEILQYWICIQQDTTRLVLSCVWAVRRLRFKRPWVIPEVYFNVWL